MSPLFVKLAIWIAIAGVGTAIFFIAYEGMKKIRIRDISWRIPIPGKLGDELKEGWDKHGIGILKSLTLISIFLLFFNWLCAETGFKWWKAWRANGGLFWVSQTSLLFSLYVFMLKIENKIPKMAASVVLVLILVGVVKNSNEHQGQQDRVESERLTRELESIMPVPVRGPFTRELRAGVWERFDVGDKLKIDKMTDGIPFTCKINDSPQEYRSGPRGGNLDLTAMAPGVFIWRVWIKPDKNMTVTIR
jgi:hypothetical protein